MFGLIGMEFRKIIEKKVVIAGIFLLMILNHMLYDGWVGQVETLRPDGSYAQGKEAVRLDQEIAGRYEGPLSDDKVRQIIKDFELPEGFNGTEYPIGYITRNNMYQSMWQFYDEYGNYNGKTIEETYGNMAGKLQLGYNKSWISLLQYMSILIYLGIAYLIIVAVASVFSEEYSRGMDALILTSRNGKTKCVRAKIIAALCFSLIIIGISLAGNMGMVLAKFGMQGWNGSLQFNYIGLFAGVPYEINYLQACIYAVGIWISASLFLTGMSLLISSFSKSNFVALIILAFIYTAPLFFNAQSVTGSVLLSMFPIQQLQLTTPFVVPSVAFLGNAVPFQVILTVGCIAACAICAAAAGRVFSRHQAAE